MKAIILVFLVSLACAQIVATNLGCKTFKKDDIKVCEVCSVRYFKDGEGICQPVSTSCRTYNETTGDCTGCYGGFVLLEVVCVKNTKPIDPFCLTIVNEECVTCSKGYYLKNKICTLFNPKCEIFDGSREVCTKCYTGLILKADNSCEYISSLNSMPGCSKFNTNGVCVECARDYFLNTLNVCVLVNADCKKFSKVNGDCTACFPGWKTESGKCVLAPTDVLDINCKSFNGNVCVACSKGFYFDQNKKCVQSDPFCKDFDFTALVCKQCYSGFDLVDSKCTFGATVPPTTATTPTTTPATITTTITTDLYCKTFNDNGVCTACSQRYYFNAEKRCVQVNDNCKTFDYTNKVCTECFEGYELADHVCKVSAPDSNENLKNCAQSIAGVCTKCSDRAFYHPSGNCHKVSDQCQTYNSFNGKCTTCYSGSSLDATTEECKPSITAACKESDPATKLCLSCIPGYYLDSQNICQKISDLCETFNFSTKRCMACYKGYVLNEKFECVLAPVLNPATTPSVKNCAKYDVSGTACSVCFKLYFLKDNICNEADPLCKSFDASNGNCLTCYTTFTLKNGKCVA